MLWYPAHIPLTYPRGGLHTLSFLHMHGAGHSATELTSQEWPSINDGWEWAEKLSNGLAFQRDNSPQTLRGFWEDWTLDATVETWSLMHIGFLHVWLSSLPHTFIISPQTEPETGFDFRSFAGGQISSQTPEIKSCLRLHWGETQTKAAVPLAKAATGMPKKKQWAKSQPCLESPLGCLGWLPWPSTF